MITLVTTHESIIKQISVMRQIGFNPPVIEDKVLSEIKQSVPTEIIPFIPILSNAIVGVITDIAESINIGSNGDGTRCATVVIEPVEGQEYNLNTYLKDGHLAGIKVSTYSKTESKWNMWGVPLITIKHKPEQEAQ